MVLSSGLLNDTHRHFNNRCKWSRPWNPKFVKSTNSIDRVEHDKLRRGNDTWKPKLRSQFPVSSQHLFKSFTKGPVLIETKHILIMCWGCNNTSHSSTNYVPKNTKKIEFFVFFLPSPNPKQGIRLSSSKEDNVLPMMDIACSYGFCPLPMRCKLFFLKDLAPAYTFIFYTMISVKSLNKIADN